MPAAGRCRPLLAVFLATTLALAAAPAHAALYELRFTGTITYSFDNAGSLFGQGETNGQLGGHVAGRALIDTAAYADANPGDSTVGEYGPAAAFPQPQNRFASWLTIGGQTFAASAFTGTDSSHAESARVQDSPVIAVVSDGLAFADESRRLVCADPGLPATCVNNAFEKHALSLSLEGQSEFITGETLAQLIDLDATAIAAIVAANGSQSGTYEFESRDNAQQPIYWTYGSFALTSLSLAPYTATPEPASLALFGLALAGLAAARRRG